MTKISELKDRLEAIPEKRKSIQESSRIVHYYRKTLSFRSTIDSMSKAIDNSVDIVEHEKIDYILSQINAAANKAEKLHNSLEKDISEISTDHTETEFLKLSDLTARISTKTKDAWKSSLESRINKWESLAEVLMQLGKGSSEIKKQANKLKLSLRNLTEKISEPPNSKCDGDSIRKSLEEMADAISSMDLDSAFGRFLQAAASQQGASIDSLEDLLVSKQIKDYGLQDVFRVTLK